MATVDMATGVADNVLYMLTEFGFFRIVIPMILIFALFFGVLEKTKVLGENKQVNTIVSFAAAFIVIASTPVVEAINKLIPATSFILVATLMLLMILTFIGFKTDAFLEKPHRWQVWIVIFLLFIFAGIIDYSTGFQIPILHNIFEMLMGQGTVMSGEATGVLIGIALVIGLPLFVLWFVVAGGKERF